MSGKGITGKGDWVTAVDLLCRWEKGTGHLDDLLEACDPGRLRWLVMEVFRQWLVLDAVLQPRLKREPRPRVRQMLRLALAECRVRPGDAAAKVVHHAGEVGRSLGLSQAERGFINAVLRACLRDGFAGSGEDLPATHPEWMVQRWQKRFGEEATLRLLQWNQTVGEIFVHAAACPAYGLASEWPFYYRVQPGRFAEALPHLAAGRTYVQDPFARVPVELLDPRPGEHVLDLCAAPGGKTRLLAIAMQGQGRLTAVDRPGRRLERLRENVSRIPGGGVEVLGAAVEKLQAGKLGGPVTAVLLDVPCSNTGVMQKRPDVKVRLQPADIAAQAATQLELLTHAAKLVAPGGRLVYSTCSLEEEENEGVVDAFLQSAPGWRLVRSVLSHPWECHHDGGGAFLLTREKSR